MAHEHEVDKPMRSASEACNTAAMREKADTVLLRQAKECRDKARELLNKAESLERMAVFAKGLPTEL